MARSLPLLAVTVALALGGCAYAPRAPIALGPYGSSEQILFDAVITELLEIGYPIEVASPMEGRILVDSPGANDDARIQIVLFRPGWIRMRLVRIESVGRRMILHDRALLELALRLRERLDVRVDEGSYYGGAAVDPEGWGTWEGAAPEGDVNPRRVRGTWEAMIAGGAIPLLVGFAGSLAIGIDVLSRPPGHFVSGDCRDAYAGLHFVPVLGALGGLVVGADQCASYAWGAPIADLLTTAPQVLGSVLLAVGLGVGQEEIVFEGPFDLSLLPDVSSEHAGLVLLGAF